AQMLLELKVPFDVIDPTAEFSTYRLIILPDDITLDADLAARFRRYLDAGGKLILSGTSGQDAAGAFAVPAGLTAAGSTVAFTPSYMLAGKALDPAMTTTPFVVYGTAQQVEAAGAEVLAQIVRPYFNRSYKHFSSHAH